MPDVVIVFKQDTRYLWVATSLLIMMLIVRGQTPEYILPPGHGIQYTWDDPSSNRSIKWGVKNGNTINSRTIIDISKVFPT